jgi:transketolase
MSDPELDELCINTIRFLAIDAVEQARSGHPGAPMGAAPMAYVLWDRFLKHNPGDPTWFDRDRFILSNGHASALLYSLLHLTGYGLSLEDLQSFRQWGSKTPGHPEYNLELGIEMTTGPLGQGFAHGVGMAIAERWLAERYNRNGHEVVDHYTYAIVSDGDLQEGVASEAASLAGTLKLGKLIYLYDDNDISIEGDTDIAFTENVALRFEAYGWHVVGPIDGMNPSQVDSAIKAAQAETGRPTLIVCRTVIGYGSPNKEGTGAAHGEPLGAEEAKLARQRLGWPYAAPFTIPEAALSHFRQAMQRGPQMQAQWKARFELYRQFYPEEAGLLEEGIGGDLPEGWDRDLGDLFKGRGPSLSTRDAGGLVMNAIADRVPTMLGGSADLAPSTRTLLEHRGDFGPGDYAGRNFHFGVREHAMGSIANGICLHGGTIPYTATFLIFSDYMRPAIRLGALMGLRVIYVFTHDSVALGQDGPTHQPVEQLLGLRAVPNLAVVRPADATETAQAWKVALERRHGPTVLVLSRQNLPVLERTALAPAEGVRRGGYTLWEATDSPSVILMATGSEVPIALEGGKLLESKGISARVVSMPSWELFDAQPEGYRNSVLPPEIKARVSIEASTPLGWERYVGMAGTAIGVPHFGASAPAEILYEKFGLTPGRVVDAAIRLVNQDCLIGDAQ